MCESVFCFITWCSSKIRILLGRLQPIDFLVLLPLLNQTNPHPGRMRPAYPQTNEKKKKDKYRYIILYAAVKFATVSPEAAMQTHNSPVISVDLVFLALFLPFVFVLRERERESYHFLA